VTALLLARSPTLRRLHVCVPLRWAHAQVDESRRSAPRSDM
jgi:hypothetical protein